MYVIMVSVLKFRTTLFRLFCLKFVFYAFVFLKILSGMANSVYPDQTEGAVRSGSALFAYAILSGTLVCEILGHLPYHSSR